MIQHLLTPYTQSTRVAMEVMTEEYDGAAVSECMLHPGEALLNCDGQDIAKKGGGKGRNRVLTVLPFQLGVGNKITDCMLGSLRKFGTEAPELVIETENGTLIYPGKFEFPSTKFLAILCQPSNSKKTGQSALTDVFDRVLVFGKPTLVPTSGSSNGRQVSQSSYSFNEDSQRSQESTISEAGATPVSRLSAHHGLSSLADPIKPSTAKRLAISSSGGSAASATKVARVKSTVVARAGPSSASKASPTKRSRKISSGDSTEGSGSDNGSGGSSSSGLSILDDSASDAEEDVSGAVGDSPVDRRSSRRRASASKPVNYRVDDINESDEDSSSGSGSGSDSGTHESEHSDNIMDVSSDDEVQVVRKPAMKRTNSTASSTSKASLPSQPTPTEKKTAATTSAKKPATAAAAKKAVAKVPVARKLADSSTKRKSSTAKAYYFSDSENESAGGSRSSHSDGEQSSQLGGDSYADSSSEQSEDSDYSEGSGRKTKKPKHSQPSPSKKITTVTSSSATKKSAVPKATAKVTKAVDAGKATSPKKKTPSKTASKAVATTSSTKSSAVKKCPAKSTSKSAAGTEAAGKKRAAAVAPKRKAAALDSDVEVISIDDSSDEDYSD